MAAPIITENMTTSSWSELKALFTPMSSTESPMPLMMISL